MFFGQITRILETMKWDGISTLRNALWITGGQWAGKTTVAGILAERYGLTHYHYDYHAMKGHEDRRIAQQIRAGQPPAERDFEAMWIEPTPRQMVDAARQDFTERFTWVLDDLRGLVTPVPVVADGWGLRPELIVAITAAPERIAVLVPTDEFRLRQAARLPRAGRVHAEVSDPARAQRNRLERDRLLAEDAVAKALELGVRVIEVDGSRDAEAMADTLAEHFGAFLPRPLAAVAG